MVEEGGSELCIEREGFAEVFPRSFGLEEIYEEGFATRKFVYRIFGSWRISVRSGGEIL